MKLSTMLKKIPYELITGDPEIEVTDLAFDSRKVKEGGIFVCLPGAAADGHDFAGKAVEAGCTHMVMEVSSQGIMMDRVYGFRFDYGLFTNLSEDHIGPDEHSSFEEYLGCKRRLFSMCDTGIVNGDDPYCDAILEGHTCRVVTFGLKEAADYRAEGLHALSRDGFLGIAYQVNGPKGSFELEVNMPGSFNGYNSLAAAALAEEMGLPRGAVNRAMGTIRVNGRMEIVYSGEDFSVIVDYAHNAVSMESLLTTLKEYHPKRLVCVFGCGGNRPKERRYAMGESAGRMADLSIVTADNSRWEKVEDIIADIVEHLAPTGGKYLTIPDRREAIRYSIAHAEKGDLIAVIGKGHEDYQEIRGVRTHFLDREEAEAALAEFGYR